MTPGHGQRAILNGEQQHELASILSLIRTRKQRIPTMSAQDAPSTQDKTSDSGNP